MLRTEHNLTLVVPLEYPDVRSGDNLGTEGHLGFESSFCGAEAFLLLLGVAQQEVVELVGGVVVVGAAPFEMLGF